MVWFYRGDVEEPKVEPVRYFQSHYGLILSKKFDVEEVMDDPFNPTMVWFYLNSFSAISSAVASFQSHYGLILS